MNSLSTQRGAEGQGILGLGVRWVAFVAIALVGGCAAIGGQTPQEVVKERAQERWQDLVKGDYKAAYAFLSPASKQLTSEKDYVESLRKDFWKSARVEKVECTTQEACEVTMSIEYEFKGLRARTPLRESWIREGTDWWYVKKS